jgi:hypothetical protein
MDWIFDHFHIVVLLLLGIGSAFKSLLESIGKSRREGPNGLPPARDLAEDKSYRKRPPSVPPPLARPPAPPPLARAVVPPAKQLAGYDAEVANETAKALKHQRDLAARLSKIRENKATTTGGATATRARVAAKGAAKPFLPTPVTLRNRLRDPAEVRRAMVMNEILSPPLSLR